MEARRPKLIRPGLFERPGRRLGAPPRISRFPFRFIVGSPYAAFAKAVSNSYAVLPPSSLRWIELMTRSSLCMSARVHLPKSVPLGYHLLTKRLQFSTEPFSQEA